MKKIKYYLKVVFTLYAVQSFCCWEINLFQFIPILSSGERFCIFMLYVSFPMLLTGLVEINEELFNKHNKK